MGKDKKKSAGLIFRRILLKEEALCFQPLQHAAVSVLIRADDGVQMNAPREVAQRERLAAGKLFYKHVNVIARKGMQLA